MRDGLALAPKTPGLRDSQRWWRLSFIVTAEKDGDVAYVGSDWNEGIMPWSFGLSFDLDQSQPMLRGTVFTDRGVYRLGEEVRLKAILRHNTPQGIRLLPSGARVLLSVRDGQNRLVTEGTVAVNAWSSAEWAFTLPAEGGLGGYSIRAILESDKPVPKKPEDLKPGDEPGPDLDDEVAYEKAVHCVIPGRRVSTARLPRRREIEQRRGEGGRSGEGGGEREVPVRRPDAGASGHLDVDAVTRHPRRVRSTTRCRMGIGGSSWARSSASPMSRL